MATSRPCTSQVGLSKRSGLRGHPCATYARIRYYIQPAARRAGIIKKIGWHTLRHTFSTLIKSLGVDAKVVQELLRHASFKTTMDGYTQALEAPKRQAQAALADLIMRTGKVGHA
jgi:site-specific recombinase XerD